MKIVEPSVRMMSGSDIDGTMFPFYDPKDASVSSGTICIAPENVNRDTGDYTVSEGVCVPLVYSPERSMWMIDSGAAKLLSLPTMGYRPLGLATITSDGQELVAVSFGGIGSTVAQDAEGAALAMFDLWLIIFSSAWAVILLHIMSIGIDRHADGQDDDDLSNFRRFFCWVL